MTREPELDELRRHEELARFVDACDAFHVPVVSFVDQPGFVIGTEAEGAGTIRRGARALAAVHQARTPWCSVLVRKAYGIAGAGRGDGSRLNLRFAWPSGDWAARAHELIALDAHAGPVARGTRP